MGKRIDLTGQRFGRLIVERISTARPHPYPKAIWRCRCDCGRTVEVRSELLRAGKTKSCGCLRREVMTKHGLSREPGFNVWQNMLQRCGNPQNPKFPDYGGRGIRVCERWHEFNAFYADMGQRSSPDLTLDRIDNNGHYEKANCRWATKTIQSKNRRWLRDLTPQNQPYKTGLDIDSSFGVDFLRPRCVGATFVRCATLAVIDRIGRWHLS